MDSYYEFILSRQNQLLSFSQHASFPHKYQGWYTKTWSRIAYASGELLIKAGSWMKRASSAPAKDNSLGIYSRN